MPLDLKQDIHKPSIEDEFIRSKMTGIVCKQKDIPVVSIPYLIEWLLGEKYTNIYETSDNMTEEFERNHKWELSRNCFINKVIKHLEQLEQTC